MGATTGPAGILDLNECPLFRKSSHRVVRSATLLASTASGTQLGYPAKNRFVDRAGARVSATALSRLVSRAEQSPWTLR